MSATEVSPAPIVTDYPGHDEHIQVVATKSPPGYVGVVIGESDPPVSTFTWLGPELARELAARLIQKADEAEASR